MTHRMLRVKYGRFNSVAHAAWVLWAAHRLRTRGIDMILAFLRSYVCQMRYHLQCIWQHHPTSTQPYTDEYSEDI